MEKTQEFVPQVLKQIVNLSCCFCFSDGVVNYWSGKHSLKRWRAIAKEELDEKIISETDLFCNDLLDQEQANPKVVDPTRSEQVNPLDSDSAKFDEVELSSQETTIILNGKSQTKVASSECATFKHANDVIKTSDVIPEENGFASRQSRRRNGSGGITVGDDW